MGIALHGEMVAIPKLLQERRREEARNSFVVLWERREREASSLLLCGSACEEWHIFVALRERGGITF